MSSFELTDAQKKMLEQRQCRGGVFTPDHKCKRMTDIWPRSGMCDQCRHYFYSENYQLDLEEREREEEESA